MRYCKNCNGHGCPECKGTGQAAEEPFIPPGVDKDDMPVCPMCQAIMHTEYYKGYYDEFTYWTCNCDELPYKEIQYGEFA